MTDSPMASPAADEQGAAAFEVSKVREPNDIELELSAEVHSEAARPPAAQPPPLGARNAKRLAMGHSTYSTLLEEPYSQGP